MMCGPRVLSVSWYHLHGHQARRLAFSSQPYVGNKPGGVSSMETSCVKDDLLRQLSSGVIQGSATFVLIIAI